MPVRVVRTRPRVFSSLKIKYIVTVVGNIVEGIININYKTTIEIFIKIHYKVIARRNAIFVKKLNCWLTRHLLDRQKEIYNKFH